MVEFPAPVASAGPGAAGVFFILFRQSTRDRTHVTLLGYQDAFTGLGSVQRPQPTRR